MARPQLLGAPSEGLEDSSPAKAAFAPAGVAANLLCTSADSLTRMDPMARSSTTADTATTDTTAHRLPRARRLPTGSEQPMPRDHLTIPVVICMPVSFSTMVCSTVPLSAFDRGSGQHRALCSGHFAMGPL
jgi:hypothetical protein